MPSRWFIPIAGADRPGIKREHLHAAFSRWFEGSEAEHAAQDKPYTISPITALAGTSGIEISTLTDDAQNRLERACDEQSDMVLGGRVRQIGRPCRLEVETWADLAGSDVCKEWPLDFIHPATFRTGDRSSPLPSVAAILRGLSRAWDLWSGLPSLGYRPDMARSVWVSDVNLRSSLTTLSVRTGNEPFGRIHVSGVTGSLTIRCDDVPTAQVVSPLLALAPYAGIGSLRGKGFGVVRLRNSAGAARRNGHLGGVYEADEHP